MRAVTILSVALFVLAGCSAQGSNDTIRAPSGAVCKVDAASICNAERSAPVVVMGSGITEDTQMREANSAATTSEFIPFQIPNGSIIQVDCEIRTENNRVIYAHVARGGNYTDHDVDYLKQQGYCSD